MTVANGNWNISPNCSGGGDSLDNILGNGNYDCPINQNTNINNANAVLNFDVQPPTPDTLLYYFTKELDFFQTDATTLVSDAFYGPFNAYLGIVQSALGSVPTANVTLPTTAGRALPAGNTAIEVQLRERFADQTTFDTVYPTGGYTFNIFTLNNGNHFPILTMPTPEYPNTPRITNYVAAQAINPGSASTASKPDHDHPPRYALFTCGFSRNAAELSCKMMRPVSRT